jgi:hypothetical protein
MTKPKREPKPGERVHAGLRVTPDLRRRIGRAAAKSGRSLSQEMEFRLERSLAVDTAFGSTEMHDMALRMSSAFAIAGESRAVEKGLTHWIDDPDCYRSAMFSVFAALIRNAPEGDEEAIARAIEGLKGILLTKLMQRSDTNAR